MRWGRPHKPERSPGEYPESFVKGFMQQTLPSATPAQAASGVQHLRSKGWTEEALAAFILPYMPRGDVAVPRLDAAAPGPVPPVPAPQVPAPPVPAPPVPAPPVVAPPVPAPPALGSVPADVTLVWLDEHVPGMDRRQMRLVVDELERRGWPSGTVAMAVLPHLLPKLPVEDARAVIAGLAELGMSDEEIARATRSA